ALDLEIPFDELELVLQRQVPRLSRQQVPEDLAESRDEPDHPRVVAPPGERRDAVEAVEEEVRLEMGMQRVEARGGELRLQPRRRQLAIPIALMEDERGAAAGGCRVDQQLEVEPAAHLHDHVRPEALALRAQHLRYRRDRDEMES